MRLQVICLVGVLLAGVCAVAEPGIYLGPEATDLEHHAATELQRYLYVATGDVLAVETLGELPKRSEGFVIGTPDSLPKTGVKWPFGLEVPAHDGYILRSESKDNALVIIAGTTPAATQNGVYGFLEEMGFGFYLSGDTYPQEGASVEDVESRRVNRTASPAFAVRGTLPWMNTFNSAAAWEWEDYKAYIDQLVRMRLNFVGFHVHDDAPLPNTSEPNCGTRPLGTDQFFAGTGEYFAQDHFGASSSFIEDRAASIQAARDLLRKALAYADSRGLQTCLGFEVDGDALDPANQVRFEARLKALLADYPTIDFVWLWQPEGMGLGITPDPAQRSLWASYTERWGEAFGEMESGRKAEAVRLALYAQHAHDVVKAVRPDVQLVMSGWGGDEWLHCTDFFPGMDKLLPEDVAFSALDNMSVTPDVSEAYGELSAERQRWPILWFEYDGDQWMPQPNLRETAEACADAVAKGCQGLLGVHWRTAAVDETAAYCARFAWDQGLTVEGFCKRRARDLFGPELGEAVAPSLVKLQDLGYRWVGGAGQSECGLFSWQSGVQEQRGQLARIGYELASMAKEKGLLLDMVPTLIPELVPELSIQPVDQAVKVVSETVETMTDVAGKVTDVTGKVHDQLLPKPIRQITDGITGELKNIIPLKLRPESSAALQDLVREIEFVLAYEEAAGLLGPDGGLDDLIFDEKTVEAIELIRNSKLPEAMHIFAGRIANKGELGVLATMNTKAWPDLRERLGVSEETLALLEERPERIATEPRLLVLPDRVIVVGLSEEELTVTLKARAMGEKRPLTEKQFVEVALEPMGRTTFALAFPDEFVQATQDGPVNIEFGVEAKGAGGASLTWPAGHPATPMTATLTAFPKTPSTPAVPKLVAKAVKPKVTIMQERNAARLTWDAQDGVVYTVSRDGTELGSVSDGWFEDLSVPSGETVEYSVAARNPATGKTAVGRAKTDVPELPLPAAPAKVQVSTRGGRVILGWESDAPQAAAYVVAKRDADGNIAEEIRVTADYGRYLQVSDPVKSGEICSYAVKAIAPDGRTGESSKETGVIASTDPLKPVVELSFEDEALLTRMADLAEQAIALGGRGWAEMAAQPEWDSTRGLTLSVWVNLEDLEGMQVLICKGPWQQSAYFLQLFQKQVRFYLAGGGTLDAGTPEVGKWQLVTATYGFDQMRIYLNGKSVGGKLIAEDSRADADALLAERYGQTDDAYFVRGVLDDIRIYDVALTEGEVEELFEDTKRE